MPTRSTQILVGGRGGRSHAASDEPRPQRRRARPRSAAQVRPAARRVDAASCRVWRSSAVPMFRTSCRPPASEGSSSVAPTALDRRTYRPLPRRGERRTCRHGNGSSSVHRSRRQHVDDLASAPRRSTRAGRLPRPEGRRRASRDSHRPRATISPVADQSHVWHGSCSSSTSTEPCATSRCAHASLRPRVRRAPAATRISASLRPPAIHSSIAECATKDLVQGRHRRHRRRRSPRQPPPPRVAWYRSPIAGASATPTRASPSISRAISVVHNGMPSA